MASRPLDSGIPPSGLRLPAARWRVKKSSSEEELLGQNFVDSLVPTPVIFSRSFSSIAKDLQSNSLTTARSKWWNFQTPNALTLEAKLQYYLVLRRGIRYETDWIGWCDEALAFLQEAEG